MESEDTEEWKCARRWNFREICFVHPFGWIIIKSSCQQFFVRIKLKYLAENDASNILIPGKLDDNN